MNTELAGFDPKVVHYVDPKTRRVEKEVHFRCHVEKGVRYYEWPKSSGNLWFGDRTAAGRWETAKNGALEVIVGAKHKDWVAPLTDDQKLARDYNSVMQENARMKQELNSIKKEQSFAPKEVKKPGAAISSEVKSGRGAAGTSTNK
jgi:hypothetical protein